MGDTAINNRCLTPCELAARWRCRPATIRKMIRDGQLAAIVIGDRVRILPEAIRQAEQGALAVKPVRRKRRETVPADIAAMLE